jgi:hypothetical protein
MPVFLRSDSLIAAQWYASLAPAFGAKAGKSMSKKIRYTNEPIQAEVIPDFLPAPDQLVMNEDGIKVTLSLSRSSVDFFKAAAERNNTSYQRMIRRLLDSYADRYRTVPSPNSSARSKSSRRST